MEASREQIARFNEVARELVNRKARNHFETFIQLINPAYKMKWFHAYIASRLDAFACGDVKNLMILVPPQHGKSEQASRLFPAYLFGQDPNKKIGLVTYNDTFAKKFNKQIQRNIMTPVYSNIFPKTNLAGSKKILANFDNYSRNTNEFEIVNHNGSMITVGRDGQITGLPIDTLIIDDLYKDRGEAVSPTISEKIWTNYNEVFKTRLHNDSQQLIMNTRWDEMDLAGRLLKSEPDEWEVIKLPAIRTNEICDYDPREEGEALWPDKHSLERILNVKHTNQVSFNSLYQQDPKPNTELLIYNKWDEVPVFPEDCDVVMWGVDWGFTNSKTVVVKVGIKGNDLYLDECFYHAIGMDKEGKSGVVNAFTDNGYKAGQRVLADRSPTEIAYLSASGVYCNGVNKPEGSVEAGILIINTFNIHITARSVNAKREANNYQWTTFGEIITNVPLKNGNDHFWDAARYPIYMTQYNRVK